MLPMGTIVTVCMLIALIFASDLPVLNLTNKLPLILRRVVAFIVLAAGCWNLFWHALRHLTEFWGLMALVSGALMIVASTYIATVAPPWLQRVRPVVLVALLLCMLKYAHTIYNL
jgi:MFS family permease